MTAAASAYFRSWRDLEALIATKGWGVRASPAIGDGADVLYFVPPPGDTPTVQVRHLGKALQASVWALRGSAGSMLALDPVTAAQVEARPHQWRVEAMVPDHPQFPTRDSFTLVCGDVLVALGLMDPQAALGEPVDPLADALAQVDAPPPETAVDALQRRVDRMAQLDPAFTVHDAGYSPDDFATTDDMVSAARMMDELDPDVDGPVFIGVDLGGGQDMTAYAYRSTTDGQVKAWDGSPPYPADHPLREQVAQLHARAHFATALMAAKRARSPWVRLGAAWESLRIALAVQWGEAIARAHRGLMGLRR